MGKQKKAIATTYQIIISANTIQNINEITGYIAFVNQQPLMQSKSAIKASFQNENITPIKKATRYRVTLIYFTLLPFRCR